MNEATLNNLYERFRSEVATSSSEHGDVDLFNELLNEKNLNCYDFCCPIEMKLFQ